MFICSLFVLVASHCCFSPPWIVERSHEDAFVAKVANASCWLRSIAAMIPKMVFSRSSTPSRVPEFMMQWRGLRLRGSGNYRWKPARRFHAALEVGRHQRSLRAQRYPLRRYGEKFRQTFTSSASSSMRRYSGIGSEGRAGRARAEWPEITAGHQICQIKPLAGWTRRSYKL